MVCEFCALVMLSACLGFEFDCLVFRFDDFGWFVVISGFLARNVMFWLI